MRDKAWSLVGFLGLLGSVDAQTGSPYWPLTPGTCIDYAVYPIQTSWDEGSHEIRIASRGSPQASQRICAGKHACPGCGYPPMPMEEYEQPPGTVRGYLTEGVAKDDSGQAYIGESGNNALTYVNSFLGKLPLSPYVGQKLSGNTGILPQAACGNACSAPSSDPWSLRVISMGPWAKWSDTVRTGLKESKYGRYNYVFAKGIGMVNFWYSNTDSDPSGQFTKGVEYFATSFPYRVSNTTDDERPLWHAYPF